MALAKMGVTAPDRVFGAAAVQSVTEPVKNLAATEPLQPVAAQLTI